LHIRCKTCGSRACADPPLILLTSSCSGASRRNRIDGDEALDNQGIVVRMFLHFEDIIIHEDAVGFRDIKDRAFDQLVDVKLLGYGGRTIELLLFIEEVVLFLSLHELLVPFDGDGCDDNFLGFIVLLT
jgi:hypothetical protein